MDDGAVRARYEPFYWRSVPRAAWRASSMLWSIGHCGTHHICGERCADPNAEAIGVGVQAVGHLVGVAAGTFWPSSCSDLCW